MEDQEIMEMMNSLMSGNDESKKPQKVINHEMMIERLFHDIKEAGLEDNKAMINQLGKLVSYLDALEVEGYHFSIIMNDGSEKDFHRLTIYDIQNVKEVAGDIEVNVESIRVYYGA